MKAILLENEDEEKGMTDEQFIAFLRNVLKLIESKNTVDEAAQVIRNVIAEMLAKHRCRT